MVLEVLGDLWIIIRKVFFLKLLQQSGNLYPQEHHPSSKSNRVVCESNNTAQAFHILVLLLVGDLGKNPLRTLSKLILHFPDVDWHLL